MKNRHSLNHEPPLPLYLGLNIHTLTRSKKLIIELHNLGLSVNYNRVLQVENQIAIAVCEDFRNKGICLSSTITQRTLHRWGPGQLGPQSLKRYSQWFFPSHRYESHFLINIISNPLGISLFQCPTVSNLGLPQENTTLVPNDGTKKFKLPDEFTVVPAVAFRKENIRVPEPLCAIQMVKGNLSGAQAQEKSWLDHAIKLMKANMDDDDKIAWSAYHASLQNPSDNVQPALTQLLPLFCEKAATATMIKHGMDVLRKATQFLNPGHISVIAVDAPLFALAKLVQCNWPQTHGVKEFVIMFGGLHAETATWKTFWRLCGVIRLDKCTVPGWNCFFRHRRFSPQGSSPY